MDENTQKYIDDNKAELKAVIDDMAKEFKTHKEDFLPKERVTKEGEVAEVKQAKGRPPRYGVKLTQDGENFVYSYILALKEIFMKKYNLEKYDAEKLARDVMCLHVLKIVYDICAIKYESRYEEIIKAKGKYGIIKFIGLIILVVFLIIVIVASIVSK